MKSLAVALLVLSGSVFGQNAELWTASISTRSKPAPIAHAATPVPDLQALVANLNQLTTSAENHISNLQIDSWKSGWRTAWLRRTSHKTEAKEMAASLEINLRDAMPALIRETQDSHGSVFTTFKLYNDLSALVESVGSLAETAETYGRKDESVPLRNDYRALSQVRQDLASYIQLTAESLEPESNSPPRGRPVYGPVLSAKMHAPK